MIKLKAYYYPLSIIGILFFPFGFLTWINGKLIPYFQICLKLSNVQASLVAFASYIAYFAMVLPSTWALKSTEYKKGMVLGLLIMALGTDLFITAVYSRTYTLFLTGLIITGAGITLLQAAVNPYIAIIGPIERTAQRIGFMDLVNKFAGILSTGILGSIFLFNTDTIVVNVSKVALTQKTNILNKYALKIVNPYIIITCVLFFLAVMIFFSNMPEINETKKEDRDISKEVKHKSSFFHYPYLIIGVLVLFLSAACKGISIDGIIIYSRSLSISIEQARHFTQNTLYAMVIGYLATIILIPKYLSQHKALQFCAVWGILLTLASYFSEGIISIYCLILTGFGTTMLWDSIRGLSIRDLGKYTKIASAMLFMFVVGDGIFPLIFGRLIAKNLSNLQSSVLLLISCYLILLIFSSCGYCMGNWKPFSTKEYKNYIRA